jgi:hypothetical protein
MPSPASTFWQAGDVRQGIGQDRFPLILGPGELYPELLPAGQTTEMVPPARPIHRDVPFGDSASETISGLSTGSNSGHPQSFSCGR